MTEIKVPDFGEGLTEGILMVWKKQEGDSVKKGEPLCDVETAKATTEIISSCDGKISKIYKPVKSVLETGEVLCSIKENDTATESHRDGEEKNDSSVFSPPTENDDTDFRGIIDQID